MGQRGKVGRIAPGGVCLAVIGLLGLPAAAPADLTLTEGQPFSGQVVDVRGCGLASAAISWGDGSPPSAGAFANGGSGVSGTHTYVDEGTYNGSVAYTCTQFSGTQTATFQATVQDAQLAGAGRAVDATAGQSFTAVVAHIDDANPGGRASDFTAQIAWGDGTTSAGSVAAAAGGGFDVTSTHTYSVLGVYSLGIASTDVGGSSITTTSAAQIAAAPPPVPQNYAAPVVSGEPRDQENLSTTTGNWSNFPSNFQYQWLRCAAAAGGSCLVVAGATASTYTAVGADVGSVMRSRVRASNAAGTSLPADSAPSAVVQPFVLRARFTIAPNPTCTGLPVTFDASISKTPNPPITRYRFSEAIIHDPSLQYYPTSPGGVLADGSSPVTTQVFGFDQDAHLLFPQLFPTGVYVADPRVITLTVSDGTGASASYSQQVDFSQGLSTASRAMCPGRHSRARSGHFAAHSIKFKVTKQTVTAKIPCPRLADCSGVLQLLEPSPLRHGQVGRPVVIADSGFVYVPVHRAASVALRLTRAGRLMLARRKPIAAIARLTSVSLTGRATTQSFMVTLRGKVTA